MAQSQKQSSNVNTGGLSLVARIEAGKIETAEDLEAAERCVHVLQDAFWRDVGAVGKLADCLNAVGYAPPELRLAVGAALVRSLRRATKGAACVQRAFELLETIEVSHG